MAGGFEIEKIENERTKIARTFCFTNVSFLEIEKTTIYIIHDHARIVTALTNNERCCGISFQR